MNVISSIGSAAAATVGTNTSLTSGIASNSATPSAGATPFADLMTDAVSSVNNLETQARSAVSGLMSGTGVDVHTAMIATQKADMAFELALSVRNKAVQAYQQVIGMQF